MSFIIPLWLDVKLHTAIFQSLHGFYQEIHFKMYNKVLQPADDVKDKHLMSRISLRYIRPHLISHVKLTDLEGEIKMQNGSSITFCSDEIIN